MSLSSTLKPLFNSGDRNRGTSYQKRGAVYSMKIDNGLLVAEVDGSYGFYEVTLDVEDFENEEAIDCTCPRFEKGYFCKHIWATILEYESVHGRRSVSNKGRRKLRQPADSKNKKSKNAKHKSVPQWQSLLNRVAVEEIGLYYDSPSPFQTATDQQAEIHYVIDASEGSPYDPATIQLSVLKRVKKTNGQWGKLKAHELSHRSIDHLVNETDQKIAAYLMGADRKYTDPYSYQMARNSFSKFDVDANWSNELCKLLLGSGRLHWTLGLSLPLEDFFTIEFIELSSPAEICINIHKASNSKQNDVMDVSILHNGSLLNNEDVAKITDDGIALLKNGLIRIGNPEAIEFWKGLRQSGH